jgi:hypothetical protein
MNRPARIFSLLVRAKEAQQKRRMKWRMKYRDLT